MPGISPVCWWGSHNTVFVKTINFSMSSYNNWTNMDGIFNSQFSPYIHMFDPFSAFSCSKHMFIYAIPTVCRAFCYIVYLWTIIVWFTYHTKPYQKTAAGTFTQHFLDYLLSLRFP